jgi:hypothetical protein
VHGREKVLDKFFFLRCSFCFVEHEKSGTEHKFRRPIIQEA